MDTPNAPLHSNQHQQPTPAGHGDKHIGIQQRIQASRLQRFAYDSAMALRLACTDKATGLVTCDVKTAKAIKELVGAWDCAADRLRVLRGRGLPAAVKTPKTKPAAQVQPLDAV
jgi:hypothetical protein